MIKIIVTYTDGETVQYSHNLDYALYLMGQLLIDPYVASVHTERHK